MTQHLCEWQTIVWFLFEELSATKSERKSDVSIVEKVKDNWDRMSDTYGANEVSRFRAEVAGDLEVDVVDSAVSSSCSNASHKTHNGSSVSTRLSSHTNLLVKVAALTRSVLQLLKRRYAFQKFIAEHTQCPQIDGFIVLFAIDHLWWEVVQCTA